MSDPIRTVKTIHAPAAIGPYAQGVVAHGLLFTAGQIAIDPATGIVGAGDITTQTDRVLRNLTAILEAAGATWGDVVKTTVYLAAMSDYAAMNDVYAQRLGDAKPARSTVATAGLPRGVLVEIDAIAALRA